MLRVVVSVRVPRSVHVTGLYNSVMYNIVLFVSWMGIDTSTYVFVEGANTKYKRRLSVNL